MVGQHKYKEEKAQEVNLGVSDIFWEFVEGWLDILDMNEVI